MEMNTAYPEGLLQIKMCGIPFLAEYKGIEKSPCSVCERESKCHTFHVVQDLENYPDYKDYKAFHFDDTHAKNHVEVIGKSILAEV
mgnify:CR=1 FL=1